MSAVVVAPDAGSGATGAGPEVVGAGWVADPTSASGKSSFGFSLRFGGRFSNASGTALLVFPSVFQDVPVSVQIRTDGPVRAARVNENEVRLAAQASIDMIDPASGTVVAGPEARSPARLTMIVAGGPPARYGLEVLNHDGTLDKLIGSFSDRRLSPIPISRGRIVIRAGL